MRLVGFINMQPISEVTFIHGDDERVHNNFQTRDLIRRHFSFIAYSKLISLPVLFWLCVY